MGYKLHQRTKSIIEYDDGIFNNLYKELSDFFDEIDVTVYKNEDNWNTWEIERSELKKAVEYLSNCEPYKYVFREWTVKELKETFEKWIKVNENKDNFTYPDYIYLDWF